MTDYIKNLIRAFLFICVAVLFTFSSCLKKCDERSYTCEGVSAKGIALLPKQLESKIFTNKDDSLLEIDHIYTKIGKKAVEPCSKDMFGLCVCDQSLCDGNSSGFVQYEIPNFRTLDTNIVTFDSGSYVGNQQLTKDSIAYQIFEKDYGRFTTYVYENDKNSNLFMQVNFNGAEAWFDLISATNIQFRETDEQANLLPTYSTPITQYTNVIEVKRNLEMSYNKFPTKFYYHLDFGVIAFENEKGTLFYQSDL